MSDLFHSAWPSRIINNIIKIEMEQRQTLFKAGAIFIKINYITIWNELKFITSTKGELKRKAPYSEGTHQDKKAYITQYGLEEETRERSRFGSPSRIMIKFNDKNRPFFPHLRCLNKAL